MCISVANVKVTHHRARKALAVYDDERERLVPTHEVQARTRTTLIEFLDRLVACDVAGIERMLSHSVRQISDGGGEFHAARVPVVGPQRVQRFMLRLQSLRGSPDSVQVLNLNGLPALLASYGPGRCKPMDAPTFVLRVDVDGDGRIREIQSVLASRKLSGLSRAFGSG